jgi:hypothetical protein
MRWSISWKRWAFDIRRFQLTDDFLLIQSNRSIRVNVNLPTFQHYNCVGKFRITREKTYSTDTNIPKRISETEFKGQKGKYFVTGFNTATQIESYGEHHRLKQKYFLEWIISKKFFDKVVKKECKSPGSICFGGRITHSLMSPEIERYGEWEIHTCCQVQ